MIGLRSLLDFYKSLKINKTEIKWIKLDLNEQIWNEITSNCFKITAIVS